MTWLVGPCPSCPLAGNGHVQREICHSITFSRAAAHRTRRVSQPSRLVRHLRAQESIERLQTNPAARRAGGGCDLTGGFSTAVPALWRGGGIYPLLSGCAFLLLGLPLEVL